MKKALVFCLGLLRFDGCVLLVAEKIVRTNKKPWPFDQGSTIH